MQPIVDGLRTEFEGKISFEYINAAGEGKALFDQLVLPGHPSYMIFLSSGNEVYRIFGVVEEDQLRDEIFTSLDAEADKGD